MNARPSWLWPEDGRTIVVLGAGGFIGSWVVRSALAAGARVVALSTGSQWRLANLADGRLRSIGLRPADWTGPDLRALAQVLIGAHALIHLGYVPPPPGADHVARTAHESTVNTDATARIARLADDCGVRLVFASSADVYGPWHDDPVGENVPPAPHTPYGIAKLAAEVAVAACVDSVSLRIGTVFGPGELGPRAIPSFIRSLSSGRVARVDGDGSDIRDYVSVEDVAAALVNATRPVPGRLLNLGTGLGRSTREVLESVAAVLSVSPDATHVPSVRPPSRLILDAAAARRDLWFSPDLDFSAAVEREAQWLLAERDRWPDGLP